jgi:hypothetical protein
MEPPFRPGDVTRGSSRSQHQSSPSASFRPTSHTTVLTSPNHDVSRQASLHLDFIIVGGGMSRICDIYRLQLTDILLHQESLDFLPRTRSLRRAIAFKYSSKRVA